MKRVLVTGANGFVGRHTLALLHGCGYEVHAVDIRLPEKTVPNIFWHQCNLLDYSAISGLITKICPTHLLHFAWYATPGKYWRSLENFYWLAASINLLRLFREAGGQRVVMAGTSAEYNWDYGYCSEYVTPCNPSSPYGVCKNALQEVLSSFSAEQNLSSAWGRIFFMYGPGEHTTRLIASVITSLLRGEAAQCTHGNQIRDFLHVEDVASAFVKLLDGSIEGAVNIASGQPVTLKEMVMIAAGYLDASERVQFGAISTSENEPPFIVADVRRLANELFWVPNYNLNEGIKQTVNWFRSNLQ